MMQFLFSNTAWTKADIPSLAGKRAIVTGGAGGIGYEISLGLAQAGAEVIIIDRNEEGGRIAMENILNNVPGARLSFESVDLGDLDSITNFCSRITQNLAVDILVNNAGICGLNKPRSLTNNGFEAHFGINYLGHFTLVAGLLPSLRRSQAPRVVNVSSLSYNYFEIDFNDLQVEKDYSGMKAYGKSKLGIMLFSLELQRRSDEENWGLRVVSCHPGTVVTNILFQVNANIWFKRIVCWFAKLFVQNAASGAIPSLFSATSTEAQAGGYYGPSGWFGLRGPVGPVNVALTAQDYEVAKKLWDISTDLTRVKWPC